MFLPAISDVDPRASPGSCQFRVTNNAQVLGYDGDTYDPEKLQEVYTIVKMRMLDLLDEPSADPLKLFIKREPHKAEKIKEGRFRLISSVSLIDALVDRILFMRLCSKQLQSIGESPLMVGWNPASGGYRLLAHMMNFENYFMVDKSSWDWTVPGWMIEALLQIVLNLAPQAPKWWQIMVTRRFDLLFREPVFIFGDGSLAQQQSPGIMKSGCYLTIYLNSISQLLLHAIIEDQMGKVVVSPPLCLGDDTIQGIIDDNFLMEYVEKMRTLGFLPKVTVGSEIEFAGFRVFMDRYIPEYRQKHLYLLMHLTEDDEVAKTALQSYQLLYAFVPDMLDWIQKICVRRSYLDAIWSNYRLKTKVD